MATATNIALKCVADKIQNQQTLSFYTVVMCRITADKKKYIEINKNKKPNEKEATEVAHALQTASHMYTVYTLHTLFTHIRFNLN